MFYKRTEYVDYSVYFLYKQLYYNHQSLLIKVPADLLLFFLLSSSSLRPGRGWATKPLGARYLYFLIKSSVLFTSYYFFNPYFSSGMPNAMAMDSCTCCKNTFVRYGNYFYRILKYFWRNKFLILLHFCCLNWQTFNLWYPTRNAENLIESIIFLKEMQQRFVCSARALSWRSNYIRQINMCMQPPTSRHKFDKMTIMITLSG